MANRRGAPLKGSPVFNYLSPTDISRATGLHRTYIYMIAKGKRTPSVEVAASLATYLGITIQEFYNRLPKR